MSRLNIIDKGAGHYLIDGDLTFATIDKQTVKSMAFLAATKEITIDLGKVANTDSAGLALMIELIKYSRAKRTQLRFSNVPKQLLSLAKLSGFDTDVHFAVREVFPGDLQVSRVQLCMTDQNLQSSLVLSGFAHAVYDDHAHFVQQLLLPPGSLLRRQGRQARRPGTWPTSR